MLKDVIQKISQIVFRNKLRILYYHRVNATNDIFAIDPVNFEKQICYLSQNYTILSLSECINLIETNTCAKNALLITFDDGYKDNYTIAYPILRKYSVPATIFLTTDFLDGKGWMWFDMVRYIIDQIPFSNITVKLGESESNLTLAPDTNEFKARKYIFTYLKQFTLKERLIKIKNLGEQCHVHVPDFPTENYAPLSWDDIREMSKNNIDFGAHTCSHDFLSVLGKEDAYYEISQSKKRIEEELRLPVLAFAYPNGQPEDFIQETKYLVEQCTYKCAFTTIMEMTSTYMCNDRFAIGRLSPGNTFNTYFKSQVSGFNLIKQYIKTTISRYFYN